MLKPINFIAVLLASTCFSANASPSATASNTPTVSNTPFENPTRSVEFEDDGILVTYDFVADISYLKITNDSTTTSSELSGFGSSLAKTNMKLPKRTDSFILPMVCEPKFEIIETLYHEIDLPSDVSSLIINENKILNSQVCSLMPLQKYRNYPVAMVEVNPIIESETPNKLCVFDRISYKILFNHNSSKRNNSAVVLESESLLDPNGLYLTNSLTPILPPDYDFICFPVKNPGYLILSAPKFQEHLEPFVKWKKILGYTVYEAYDNNWTPDKIKSYISNLYQEHQNLQYLLIVGDHSLVPAEIKYNLVEDPVSLSLSEKDVLTDFHYACLDGDEDLFPDIYHGRWPVRTISELEYIIEKSIRYEMEPTTDSNFYDSASHFGYFEDNGDYDGRRYESFGPDGKEDKRFIRTCEDVRNYLLGNGHLSQIDRLYTAFISPNAEYPNPNQWAAGVYCAEGEMPEDLKYENGFSWNANADSIILKLNEGRLYFLYRGHGFPEGWALLGNGNANFDIRHINSLANIDVMPLILSLTCETGNHNTNNNFVRNLLSSPYGGTYASFAQTNESISGVNDLLTAYFINCIWPSPGFNLDFYYPTDYYWQNNPLIYQSLPALRLGQMLEISLNGTVDRFGLSNSDESMGLYLKRITHCFGDPSILFRKKVPLPLSGVNITRNPENGTIRVSTSGDKVHYISFYDRTNDESTMYRGYGASYTTSKPGEERYVDVYVYNSESIPYFEQGENYDGYVTSEDQSRLISHSLHSNGKYLDVTYYLSEAHKNRNMGIIVVDLQTNSIIHNTKLDTSKYGIKNNTSVYVNNGLMMISLTVDGMPISNMKVFVPQN